VWPILLPTFLGMFLIMAGALSPPQFMCTGFVNTGTSLTQWWGLRTLTLNREIKPDSPVVEHPLIMNLLTLAAHEDKKFHCKDQKERILVFFHIGKTPSK
jgi:hypothetical protein